MKFIVNSQNLLKHLQLVGGVFTGNNNVQIINCFHLHLDNGLLTIKATDLQTTLISKIEVESNLSDGNNEVAVPARILLDILKNLSDAPLTMDVDKSRTSIEIRSGEGVFHMSCMDADTFPATPVASDTTSIEIPSDGLLYALDKTIFAASTDDTRPQMTGILCDITPEHTTFVATDAHKLVRYRRLDVKADDPASFILPKKPISIVKNMLLSRKEDSLVKLDYNKTNIFLTFDNFHVICRLIDGRYPNYEAAIPKENPNRMTIDRLSFLGALRRVKIFANEATRQICLNIDKTEITLIAENDVVANHGTDKVPCQYEGEPIRIGFNANFLTEMVNNLETEEIVMELSTPSRAGILLPQPNEEQEGEPKDSLLMLVMPVMLAN